MEERIARVKQLLAEIHHVPVSTVNEDGSPHNTPVFMAFNQDTLTAYWISSIAAQHSQNIARDGRVFLVVFDSREGHGGLYIQANATVEDETDAAKGHDFLKHLKDQTGSPMGEIGMYTGSAPQRIYRAEPSKVWVNISERNEVGVIASDQRCEIPLSSLMGWRVQ